MHGETVQLHGLTVNCGW